MPRTPEAEARDTTDRRLAAGGWTVQNREEADVNVGAGVVIREFSPVDGDQANCQLRSGGHAIGAVQTRLASTVLSTRTTELVCEADFDNRRRLRP